MRSAALLVILLFFPAPALAAASDAARPLAISWGAAALIGLCYYLAQSAWLAGLGFWTLYRPLVAGALVGLILGDPAGGARVGAAINLAYVGFIAVGGALPSDIALAGYVGAALALGGGLTPETALTLTVPAGMLGYLSYQARMTLSVPLAAAAARRAAVGDLRGLTLYNIILPQALTLLLTGVPCALAVYYGPAWLGRYLAQTPPLVMDALALAGGLLPALGIALSLNLLWRRPNSVLFVAAFVLAAFTHLPILALVALALAAGGWGLGIGGWGSGRRGSGSGVRDSMLGDQGPKSATLNPNPQPPIPNPQSPAPRPLLSSWLTWLFFSHSCYNYETMQGVSFAQALAPILRRLYPDRERLGAALARHTGFFNTEPNLGALTLGAVGALEERLALEGKHPSPQPSPAGGGSRTPPLPLGEGEPASLARGEGVSPAAIAAIKTGLMGPLSGLGDALIQGALAPLLLSVGIGLAREGSLWGAALYTLAIAALIWGVGGVAFWQGYRQGGALAQRLGARGDLARVIALAERVGAAVLGWLAATLVHVPVRLAGEALHGALSLGLVLAYLALIRRGVAPRWLILGALGAALLGRWVGVM